MFSFNFARRWTDAILSPKVSDEELADALKRARQGLPLPVFWLLGKTQSGKSSLVRALTGSTEAEIGEGFRPCTRTARVFDFPDPETAFVRFLDTRGLSEAGYDPEEDVAWCEQQAHVLIVTIKAMDHPQESVMAAVRRIHKAHPEWPVLVAQTCLHEGYPSRSMEHIEPYPYGSEPFAETVPADLRRSLLKQREWFDGMNARFVPLDFTLSEEGYQPVYYGLDVLWEAIEAALPMGLRSLLTRSEHARPLHDVYGDTAHPHIVGYAVSAGLAAAIPVPAASLATVMGVQGKLCHSIAAIYGLPLTWQSLSEISSAVGLGALAGMGGRELAKLIPGYGQTVALGVAGLYTAAATYALGKLLCFYFAKTRQGHAFTPDMLREVYRNEFDRGREMLRSTFKENKEKQG
jgi:uncharacterized protein (DUF697 family)